MSFRRLILGLSLLAVLAFGVRFSVDTDSWWHLAAGEWMVANRSLLDVDVFSHSRGGEAWVNHSWLGQIILYASHSLAGLPALNLLTALLAVAAFAFLWDSLSGPELLRGFVILLAAATAAIFWSARPQMFTFFLTAVFLWILERWRRGDEPSLWPLPLIMVFWVNLHGGFVIGFLCLSGYLAGAWLDRVLRYLREETTLAGAVRTGWSRTRGVLAAAFACLVAVSINPQGPVILALPFRTVSLNVLAQYVQEWQSPNFHSAQTLPFAAMLLLFPLALAGSQERRHPTELVLYAGFGFLALSAARNISVFALAAAPGLSRHGTSSLRRLAGRFRNRSDLPDRWSRRINLLFFGLAVLATVLWAGAQLRPSRIERAVRDQQPVAAVDHLAREGLPGPLLNSYDWGGYVIWRLWPEYRTFVDGRTDLFGDQLLGEYLSLWRAEPGWEALMERWGFRTVLLERRAPLVEVLLGAGWQVEYMDAISAVLTRP